MAEAKITVKQDNHAAGVAFGLGAFILWGVMPVYFKELAHVPAMEFLGYRMVWSFVFLIFLLFFRRTLQTLFHDIKETFGNRKLLLMLMITAACISSNWLVFIWAVTHDNVVQTSLGYFINPLVNVMLGMLVLGETLSRIKLLAVALAALGVAYMIVMGGTIPWISLFLASTFALYGLIRKQIVIGAILGLWVEMLMVLPVAVAYLIYLQMTGTATAGSHSDSYTLYMLALSGAVTTIPLMCFAAAAKRLPLSTVGLLQYLAPSISLVLAVFLWNEPFTRSHMISFGFIWAALFLYSMDAYFLSRARRPVPPTL